MFSYGRDGERDWPEIDQCFEQPHSRRLPKNRRKFAHRPPWYCFSTSSFLPRLAVTGPVRPTPYKAAISCIASLSREADELARHLGDVEPFVLVKCLKAPKKGGVFAADWLRKRLDIQHTLTAEGAKLPKVLAALAKKGFLVQAKPGFFASTGPGDIVRHEFGEVLVNELTLQRPEIIELAGLEWIRFLRVEMRRKCQEHLGVSP